MTRRSRAAAALAAAVVAVVAALVLLGPAATKHAPHAPESIFQDDDHLIYASSGTVAHVLGVLQALGVNRIRLTIDWKAIAPDPGSRTEPAGFDATDPADYASYAFDGSPGIWNQYDRVVEMAAAHGIAVDFNVTAPGPLWAMQAAPVTPQYGTRPADHYEPSATDFGEFVQALGTRYSGSYVPPAPPPPTTTTPNPPPITIPIIGPLETRRRPPRRRPRRQRRRRPLRFRASTTGRSGTSPTSLAGSRPSGGRSAGGGCPNRRGSTGRSPMPRSALSP